MSHSHPDLSLTQPIRTAQTEKDPASNAHSKELRGAVEQRRGKDKEAEKEKGMMARGAEKLGIIKSRHEKDKDSEKEKGLMARGAEKVTKIRNSITAFTNYGNEGAVSGGQRFYSLDKKKGQNLALIIRCNSISSTKAL